VDWMNLAETGTSGGSYEHDNEPAGSIEAGNFVTS
jgi:hypothetical protein